MEHKEGCKCPLVQSVLFIRDDGWAYTVKGREDEPWPDHARLNPGTIRIEDMSGKVIWELKNKESV